LFGGAKWVEYEKGGADAAGESMWQRMRDADNIRATTRDKQSISIDEKAL
jgi:hypothetical protein